MPVTKVNSQEIHVNEEGFLMDPAEWNEELGTALAARIGLTLTDEHWDAIRFLRKDFAERLEAPSLRRMSSVGGFPIKSLFVLFPKKPAKKMAYVAGLPKPQSCV